MNRILLIEDEAQLSENIVELLELSGFEVISADGALAGAEWLLKESFDLVLCDISLPDREGYYVIEEYKKTNLVMPFIFLSARVDQRDIRKALTLGADDYIMKPFNSQDLLDVVKTQLVKYERIRRILTVK